jgi:hypothetical protein
MKASMWLHLRLGLFLLVIGLRLPAYAQGTGVQVIQLNETRLRIGDSMAEPLPVGTSWKTTFEIGAVPKWAVLSVEASDSSYENPVIVNETTLGTLTPVPSGQWLPSEFEIGAAQLRRGSNSLEVRSVARRNNYDDLYVRAVTLTLGYTDPPTIRSLSHPEAVAGITILLSGDRFDPEDTQVFLDTTLVPSLFSTPSQGFFRVPRSLEPGTYALTVRSGGARSEPMGFTILPGDPVYAPLAFGTGGAESLPGDIAPSPGTDGRPYGDGALTLSDAIRILRRVLGLEPDPWP